MVEKCVVSIATPLLVFFLDLDQRGSIKPNEATRQFAFVRSLFGFSAAPYPTVTGARVWLSQDARVREK